MSAVITHFVSFWLIFCVENLHFVTIVQHYRKYVEDNEATEPLEKRVSLKLRKRVKTQEQIITDLLVDGKAGVKTIDITKLQLEFVEMPKDLQNMENAEQWKQWIFDHYISNDGDHCLNLSSKLRKRYMKRYSTENQQSEALFFDEAQKEIWKLMAQDSMVHFRNTAIYKTTMWQQEDDKEEE
eukprot:56388_1